MKELFAWLAALAFYIMMAGITYGYEYADGFAACHASYPNFTVSMCSIEVEPGAAASAIVWPLYWPGHLARVYFTGGVA